MILQAGEQMYIGQDQWWDEDPEAPAKSPAILLVYFYSRAQQGTKGLTHNIPKTHIFTTWIGTPATVGMSVSYQHVSPQRYMLAFHDHIYNEMKWDEWVGPPTKGIVKHT